MTQKTKKLFWILLVGVFIINLCYSFFYDIKPIVDAGAYDDIAWNVAQGIGYVENAGNGETPEKDNAVGRVGPGFQFFLAGIYSVFGHNIPAVWIIHALMRVLTVAIVVGIALRLFKDHTHKETIALIAGLLIGLSPDLIVVQAMLLTETLGVLLLAASIWLSLILIERPTWWSVLGASLVFTLGIMTRPTTALMFFIVVGVLLYKRKWLPALCMFLFPVLIMTPWALRNHRIYDHLVLTSSTGGYDLWVGNNLEAIGGFDKSPEIKEARKNLHIIELDKLGFEKYFSFIAEHPVKFVELQFRKTTMYFSLIRPTGFWSYLRDTPIQQGLTLLTSGIWTATLLIAGIAGFIWMLMRRRDIEMWLVGAFAILQPIAVIPIIVEARYRYPLFPFLALFGAVFLIELYTKWNTEEGTTLKRVLAYTLLVLLMMTGADTLYNAEDIVGRIDTFLEKIS